MSNSRMVFRCNYVITLFDPQNSYKKRYQNTHNWVSWRCPFQTPLYIIDSNIFWILQCFDRNFFFNVSWILLQGAGSQRAGSWCSRTLHFSLLMSKGWGYMRDDSAQRFSLMYILMSIFLFILKKVYIEVNKTFIFAKVQHHVSKSTWETLF